MTAAEKLARRLHDLYEQMAPGFGYTTREETRQFIPESPNGKLMIAVCEALAASPEVAKLIADAEARGLERAAKGLRVKPLEWVSGWFCDQDAFYADTSTGNWAVVQYSSRNGRWAYDDPSGEASDDDWGSASLAQAAAQSDYEARILDTLEVTK